MKKCPKCGDEFAANQSFCDLDGAALLDEEEVLRASLSHGVVELQDTLEDNPIQHFNSSVWAVGIGGVFVGVVLCAFVYLALMWPDEKTKTTLRDRSPAQLHEIVSTKPNQAAVAPVAIATPQPEMSESPSPQVVSSTQSAPAAPAEAPIPRVTANLNEQSVSTGVKTETEPKHSLIVLKDGSTVEADAAWRDSQGVWYRRSGLVSFVESSRVEKITETPQAKAASAEASKPSNNP